MHKRINFFLPTDHNLSVDILNIIFGIIATLLAVGGIWATIWAARRYRNTTSGSYFSVSYCSRFVVQPRMATATRVCMEWSAGIGVQPGKGTSAGWFGQHARALRIAAVQPLPMQTYLCFAT